MKYPNNNEDQYIFDIISSIVGVGPYGGVEYLNENGKFAFDDFSEQTVKSWKKFLKRIRFINPENKFDYSKYGDFFFLDNNLYVLTDKEYYAKYDLKNELRNSKYRRFIEKKKYLIRGFFAGFYLGRRDDYGERMYYGDILKIDIDNFSKCIECEFYNGPNAANIELLKVGGFIKTIYGPITLQMGWQTCKNSQEPFYIVDQMFGQHPNLCMAVKKEIVANVYYDTFLNNTYKFNLQIINKAALNDVDYTCEFWWKYVPKNYIDSNKRNEIWEYAIWEYGMQKGLRKEYDNEK